MRNRENIEREIYRAREDLESSLAELKHYRAAFFRVVKTQDTAQIALVLLNKGDAPAAFRIDRMLQPGRWRRAIAGGEVGIGADGVLATQVPAHGVEVFVLDARVRQPQLLEALASAAQRSTRH